MGGSAVQGNAKISSGLDATTVTQASSRAVINWQSFDVAAGKAVVFNQPDAQSATLNRVTGNKTSTIAGQITSNGAVYLINPNGIAITSTGSISGGIKTGGLIGYQQAGSLTNGLWDTQTTGMASGFGYQKSGATFSGTGLTTLQAQDYANYATTYPGFDFTTLWTTPNQAGQNGQTTAAYPTLTNRP